MRALIAAVVALLCAGPVSALSRGDLLVLDASGARVLRVTPQGAVSTLTPTNTPNLPTPQTSPRGRGVARGRSDRRAW